MPEAHDDWIPGRVDQFVNLVGIEPIEVADVEAPTRRGCRGRWAAAERPAVGRNRRPRRGDACPVTVNVACAVSRSAASYGRNAAPPFRLKVNAPSRGMLRSENSTRVSPTIGLPSGCRAIGKSPAEPRRRWREIALPPGVDDRVAKAQREVVAARPVHGPCRVQRVVAAIVRRVIDLAVAAGHVDRLQDEHGRAELDGAARVAWSLIEIDDDGIERIARVDFEMRRADQALVGAGGPPRGAAGKDFPLVDDQRDQPRVSGRRRHEHEECGGQQPSSWRSTEPCRGPRSARCRCPTDRG